MKNFIKSFLQSYTTSKITYILNDLNLKFLHDDNNIESEFRIINRFYAISIQFSKIAKGCMPQIITVYKSEKRKTTEVVKLNDLGQWIVKNIKNKFQ